MIFDLIYYLFTVHILVNSPLLPAGTILSATLYISNVVLYIYFIWYLKNNPQEIPDLSRIPTFDGFPNPILARQIFWALELFFMHMVVYYMWYNNWWNMSNAYWIEMYCYWLFTGYVLYRWRNNEH